MGALLKKLESVEVGVPRGTAVAFVRLHASDIEVARARGIPWSKITKAMNELAADAGNALEFEVTYLRVVYGRVMTERKASADSSK